MALFARKHNPAPDDDFLPDARRIADIISSYKAEDIRGYDLTGLALFADAFLLCTATSEPQMRAVYNGVREQMKQFGLAPRHAEGTPEGDWLLIDFGSIIVHVFKPEARAFYDLDGLWADAQPIDLALDADST